MGFGVWGLFHGRCALDSHDFAPSLHSQYDFPAILVVGWIRLLRARKSQLFLGSAGKFSAAAVDRHERTGKFPAPLKEIVMKDAGTVTTVEKRKEKEVLQVDTKREAKERAVAEEKGLHDTADKKDGSQI